MKSSLILIISTILFTSACTLFPLSCPSDLQNVQTIHTEEYRVLDSIAAQYADFVPGFSGPLIIGRTSLTVGDDLMERIPDKFQEAFENLVQKSQTEISFEDQKVLPNLKFSVNDEWTYDVSRIGFNCRGDRAAVFGAVGVSENGWSDVILLTKIGSDWKIQKIVEIAIS